MKEIVHAHIGRQAFSHKRESDLVAEPKCPTAMLPTTEIEIDNDGVFAQTLQSSCLSTISREVPVFNMHEQKPPPGLAQQAKPDRGHYLRSHKTSCTSLHAKMHTHPWKLQANAW